MVMYDTDKLKSLLDSYLIQCNGHPTKQGLAIWLNTTPTTIYNYINGTYNGGFTYGKEPHINRVVDNKDFAMIRDLFKG